MNATMKIRHGAVAVLTGIGVLVGAEGSASASIHAQACSLPDWSAHPQQGDFLSGPVNIRSGPYLGCFIRGTGRSGNGATYWCWRSGDGGTWTFLTNNTTGIQGWSKDTLLTQATGGTPGTTGSNYHC